MGFNSGFKGLIACIRLDKTLRMQFQYITLHQTTYLLIQIYYLSLFTLNVLEEDQFKNPVLKAKNKLYYITLHYITFSLLLKFRKFYHFCDNRETVPVAARSKE